MSSRSLEELRRELAATDQRLLHELGRRLELARQVGELRRMTGQSGPDFTLEGDIVRRLKAALQPLGLNTERSEAFVGWLAEETAAAQESGAKQPLQFPEGSDAIVVGGPDRMGRWFQEFLRGVGFRVGVVDPLAAGPASRVLGDLGRAAQDADLVVVATPIRVAAAIYRQLWSTETEAIVFDVLSVKGPLIPWIRRGIDRGFRVTSLHALFGPQTRSLVGRSLIVLDCGDSSAATAAERLFGRTALQVTRMPLEQHDPIMADALALPHALSQLFARTLGLGPYDWAKLAAAAPESFRRLLDLGRVVAAEDPGLLNEMHTLNPASRDVFRRLERAATELQGAVPHAEVRRSSRLFNETPHTLENPPEEAGHETRARPTGPPIPGLIAPRLRLRKEDWVSVSPGRNA